MPHSDTSSIVSSESDDVENIILDQPMYYVLNQFLSTDDGKSIATCVSELTEEISKLREVLTSLLSRQQ